MDRISKEKRSMTMSQIHSRDTKPEKKFRSAIFKLGYRYRLCDHKLPGTPDVVLRKYQTVVFINGCFWHHHNNCKSGHIPKSNIPFWEKKLARNVARDERDYKELQTLGWHVLVIWECEIKKIDTALNKFLQFISNIGD